MVRFDSGRRPGLGETFLSVYGITRGMSETDAMRNPREASRSILQKLAASLRKRVRPRRG